jgi:predicted ribosomally synthesized peptide with nif11-like leader
MSLEQLKALRAATADNDQLRAELEAAQSTEEFVRVANEHGFDVMVADMPTADDGDELSDAELESASGGYTFPRTDWIYCDNPWTNYWCTLRC